MARNKEALAELRKIRKLVGKLTTREDFIKLFEYRKPSDDVDTDNMKTDIWREHIMTKDKTKDNTSCEADRAAYSTFSELSLFEILDEFSEYFIPEQELHFQLLDELPYIATIFVNLAGRNSTSLLELEGGPGSLVSAEGGQRTHAERLRAYLKKHKRDNGFPEWTRERLAEVGRIMHEALKSSWAHRTPAPRVERDKVAGSSSSGSSIEATHSQEVNTGRIRNSDSNFRKSKTPSSSRQPATVITDHNGNTRTHEQGYFEEQQPSQASGSAQPRSSPGSEDDFAGIGDESTDDNIPDVFSSPEFANNGPTTLNDLEDGRARRQSPSEFRSRFITLKAEPRPENQSSATISPEVQGQVIALEALVGNIKTERQIERVSLYLDDLRFESAHELRSQNEQDEIKAEAFRVYLHSGKVDTDRMWWDLDFWRLMKEMPSSIVDFDEVDERHLRDELLLLTQRWVSLAASGQLGKLVQHKDIKELQEKNGTPADILTMFLELYRHKKGFDVWTREHMSNARIKVIKVWKQARLKRPRTVDHEVVEAPAAKRREGGNTSSLRKHTSTKVSQDSTRSVKNRRAERAVSDLYGPD